MTNKNLIDRLLKQDELGIMGVPNDHKWVDYADAARAIEQRDLVIESLSQALAFYADISKYPEPFTGGMGALWEDCGSVSNAALLNAHGETGKEIEG